MKYILLYLFVFLSLGLYSQIGINTLNQQSGALHIDALGNNADSDFPSNSQTTDDVLINSAGYVAIGHINPLTHLHIKALSSDNGAMIIEDGSQGALRLLGSDALGNASWSFAGETVIARGVLGAGVTYTISAYVGVSKWIDTKAYIDLTPGTWMVTVTMLLSTTGTSASDYLRSSWIRSSFSDTPGGGYTPDIEGANLTSGIAYGATMGTLEGFLVLKNSGTKSKRYYYKAGYSDLNTLPNTAKLSNFASSASGENYILAFKIKNN